MIRSKLIQAFQEDEAFRQAPDARLHHALEHVLSHPGSMVRASLAYQIGHAFSLTEGQTTNLSIGIEYMHTASLVFDDLPSMDDALERRGAPCVHVLFGESTAILVALTLINRAYALLWSAMAGAGGPAAARLVERCFGLHGMISGQSRDLQPSAPWTSKQVLRVSLCKTVALVRLTLVLPALLGGASKRAVELFDRLAVYWGLAYQILDDLKDVHSSAAVTGKTPFRDATLDRPNLYLVQGEEQTVRHLSRLIRQSERTLTELAASHPELGFLQATQARLTAGFLRPEAPAMTVCA